MSQSRPISAFRAGLESEVIENLCASFKERFEVGDRPQVEEYLEMVAPCDRRLLLVRMVSLDYTLRRSYGEKPQLSEYLSRFPDERELLERLLSDSDGAAVLDQSTRTFAHDASGETPVANLNRPPIASRYQLIAKLGTGAFGQVWKAYDLLLKRYVAVKLPRPDRPHSAASLRTFLFEAQRIAQLKSEGIVQVYDVVDEGGQFFIVSELYEGGTLANRIREREKDEGARLPVDAAVRLIADVAAAIHRVHVQNITHRDLKPLNILLDNEGRPAVADFGLAVSEEEQLDEAFSTAGTPAYMSPEQARGDNGRVDARSDIFSLGVILYQLLCGRLPFVGRDPADYRQQILTREPQPPRTIDDTIPAELERICLKCLAKLPSDRYTTALDLADDLRRFQTRQSPARLRSFGRSASVLTAVLLLGMIGGYAGWSLSGPSVRPTKAQLAQDRWTKVFGKAPSLLRHPGFMGEGTLEWSEQKRALDLDSTDIRLVQLGENDDGNFRLQVDCQRSSWIDGIGIFLGYHLERIGNDLCPVFQLIWLGQYETPDFDRRFRIQRWSAYIHPRHGTLHSRDTLHRLDLPWPTSAPMPRLAIEVRQRKVQRIVWCGREIPDLVSEFAESKLGAQYYVGAFGLYHERGAAWFSEPVFELIKGANE